MPCGRSTPTSKHPTGSPPPPPGGANPLRTTPAGTAAAGGTTDVPSPHALAEGAGATGRIRLRVPAARAFGALPPLTASGLAERFGFSRAEIDGLCSALDTTIGAMVDAVDAPEDVLAVDFTVRPHHLVVQLASPAQRLSPAAWQTVGRQVAGWVTTFEPTDVGARLSLDGSGPDLR